MASLYIAPPYLSNAMRCEEAQRDSNWMHSRGESHAQQCTHL